MSRGVRALRAAIGAVAVGTALAACAPPRVTGVRDPAGARRFEILDAADSTFKFVVTGTKWIRAGQAGIAVDPRRRDALVAQFVVQRRVADTATALITGQTARVAPQHVVLIDPPRTRLVRRRDFWMGVLTGGLLGAGAALTAR